ncbi:ATP-binding protein [Methanothermococcus okinawensis]|uniref:AAA ATPase n=1 Tax=Methanothermococcus okinawensis (strain DSM 14208 / JCM 11175 / IH1) TaxID=647113 RepID=F8AMA0_METOI|nr:ATP-binding protein [Methanothermococcus okinawensis]AEH06790.1 AAA ATPase [Methanothermococcus okinawensis IH1]
MKFFNREKEIFEILSVLDEEPNNIYFIYGPINSGKTTLINHIINNKLNDGYKVFYINFRTLLISEKRDFIEAIFTTKKEGILEKIKDKSEVINILTKGVGIVTGIPIPEVELNNLFEARINDAFQYLNDILLETKKCGKRPIIIFDELQMIKEITANGQKYLLKEIFQFLVSLTKEQHLAHCLCLTSDSLFVEYVYNTGELRGRVEYIFVDDFDKKIALKFMEFLAREKLNRKLSNDEKELIYSYVGGKAKDIYDIIIKTAHKNLRDVLEEKLLNEVNIMEEFLRDLNYIKPEVNIRGQMIEVNKKEIREALELFKKKYIVKLHDIPKHVYVYLINENILFLNPQKGILKPQSFLVWNAIKKVV